jgi:hypothetical protein
MFSEKKKAAQAEFWVATHPMAKTPKGTFYSKLDETLESFGFAEKVRQLCAPAYKQTSVGRPGIDPVVYSKTFPASGRLRRGVPTPSRFAGF